MLLMLEGQRRQGELAKEAIEKDHGPGLHDMDRVTANQGGITERSLFDLAYVNDVSL